MLISFEKEPDSRFLAWESPQPKQPRGLLVKAKNAKGGLVYRFEQDLSGQATAIPRLQVQIRNPGQARQILLQLFDRDQTRAVFSFRFPPESTGSSVRLIEQHHRRLGDPEAVDQAGGNARLDLKALTRIQIVGDWSPKDIEFLLESVELIPDSEASQTIRNEQRREADAKRKREAQQLREREQRKQATLEKGASHPADGARVAAFRMASPSLLHITLIEYDWIRGGQRAFQPGPDHQIQANGKMVLAREAAEVVEVPKNRRVSLQGQHIGVWLKEAGLLREVDQLRGSPLALELLEEPRAYRLQRGEAGKDFFFPKRVHRKSRPIGGPKQVEGKQIQHDLFLELPELLKPGERLRLHFWGINTRQAQAELHFHPEENLSESIQVSQVGYRPDDPYKVAMLSLWKGSGGAESFDDWVGKRFYLLDGQGTRHEAGTIQKRMSVSEGQQSFRSKRNHAGTHLYRLDFTSFSTPGRYRVLVEGMGVSQPFPIDRNVWRDAFRVSMKGFLHHRSGIALGPPLTPYRRPLGFHPSTGPVALQCDVTRIEGEIDVIHESMSRLHATAPQVKEAWGGYMDAGDWDRRAQHLSASFLHLELLELFPERLGGLALAVPEAERKNPLPDLLDEVLWNVECYQRLQTAEGGIRGGIESTEHPRSGECSWQESLVLGVFAPDPVSSYLFCSTALKCARVLKAYQPERAARLHAAGLAAWRWAEKQSLQGWTKKQKEEHRRERCLAAIQSYAITGERSYLEAYRESSHLLQGRKESLIEDQHALFVAATLPDRAESRELKAEARRELLALADRAILFQQGNAFDRATPVFGLPMMGYLGYFSVPEMITVMLPRAHAISGDPRYLRAAVGTCNFPNGANPNNMVYTTGVGQRFPRNPLHIDSRESGQEAPSGITVYGQSDAQARFAFNEWVHDWQLNDAYPPSRDWPTVEAYFDVFLWPAQSEYTVHQTMV